MGFLRRLLDSCAYPVPARRPAIKMQPDSYGLADEMRIGYRADKAAIFAVVAIVAHDEIVIVGHDIGAIGDCVARILDQDLVFAVTQWIGLVAVIVGVSVVTVARSREVERMRSRPSVHASEFR